MMMINLENPKITVDKISIWYFICWYLFLEEFVMIPDCKNIVFYEFPLAYQEFFKFVKTDKIYVVKKS